MIDLPKIVSQAEWQAAHEALLAKEKAATRERDALAAERRRQPMVKIDKDYEFEGPRGRASLLDLFAGRRQLILYHFMFGSGVDGWPDAGCDGCSMIGRSVRRGRAFARARYVAGAGLDRADREHRGLPQADGLVDSVVLICR
jgi:predicted dithiol-disulfide oxidoreductase (DUF899 family)